jgi:hypothetical protein
MLEPARTPGTEPEQVPDWIALASIFVGQSLDRRAAIGAYVAGGAILVVSLVILLIH